MYNPIIKYQQNRMMLKKVIYKVYKICLSAYYAKKNTKGIPWLFLSGGILATLLEQVLQRVLLPISARMLLLFLVIGGLVLVNKKVKQSFIEKYQYVEEHTIGNSMEKEEILKLYTLGKWNRRALGFLRWNYWDYLFPLWRIYGGGKSKKISTVKSCLTWFGDREGEAIMDRGYKQSNAIAVRFISIK